MEFGSCFLNYLTTIGKWYKQNKSIFEDDLIYIRDNILERSIYSSEEVYLCGKQFHEKGSIFNGKDLYNIYFQINKFEGVLNIGCLQEEILFG